MKYDPAFLSQFILSQGDVGAVRGPSILQTGPNSDLVMLQPFS